MARAKTKVKASTKKATPRRAPAARAASPRARQPEKATVSAAVTKQLLALDETYAQAIDLPVSDISQEARELGVIAVKHGARLTSGSRLDRKLLTSLGARRDALEATEARWATMRLATLPDAHHPLEGEATDLKREAIAALRHFLPEDEEVQRRVDAIIPGTGIADLVDDVAKLGALLEENKAALKRADLPRNAAKRALKLGKTIGEAAAAHAVDQSVQDASNDAMWLRNRAYWWLREAMDEIRSAGRYIFRNEPRKLSLFRASATRAKDRYKPRAPAPPAKPG